MKTTFVPKSSPPAVKTTSPAPRAEVTPSTRSTTGASFTDGFAPATRTRASGRVEQNQPMGDHSLKMATRSLTRMLRAISPGDTLSINKKDPVGTMVTLSDKLASLADNPTTLAQMKSMPWLLPTLQKTSDWLGKAIPYVDPTTSRLLEYAKGRVDYVMNKLSRPPDIDIEPAGG